METDDIAVDIIISIHALREESDGNAESLPGDRQISIHALREESDLDDVVDHVYKFKFQSTPSARRATPADGLLHPRRPISIHALREESD